MENSNYKPPMGTITPEQLQQQAKQVSKTQIEVQQQTINEQPIETPKETQKVSKSASKSSKNEVELEIQKAKSMGIDEQSLANIISKSVAQALIAQQNYTQQQQMELEKERLIENQQRYMDKTGLASQTFKQLMEKEIKEGRYTDFVYFSSMAKKHGKKTTLNISGYKMDFLVGQKTRVPNVLLPHITLKFEGLNIGYGKIVPVEVRENHTGGAILGDTTQQAQTAIDDLLRNYKR